MRTEDSNKNCSKIEKKKSNLLFFMAHVKKPRCHSKTEATCKCDDGYS